MGCRAAHILTADLLSQNGCQQHMQDSIGGHVVHAGLIVHHNATGVSPCTYRQGKVVDAVGWEDGIGWGCVCDGFGTGAESLNSTALLVDVTLSYSRYYSWFFELNVQINVNSVLYHSLKLSKLQLQEKNISNQTPWCAKIKSASTQETSLPCTEQFLPSLQTTSCFV